MFKKISKPVTLLIIVIVLSSFLTVTASGSFFYRNAVLGCEAQKTLLINLDFSYTYLLNTLQENSRKYIFDDNQKSRDIYLSLVKDYQENNSINLNFDPVSELQATAWLSGDFSQDKSSITNLTKKLNLNENELLYFKMYLEAFNQIMVYLSNGVETKDINVFTNPSYNNTLNEFSYYMNIFASSYITRINGFEDYDLKLQDIFGLLSLFLSLTLAAFGAFAAYFAIIINRNNSYYRKLFGTTVDAADFGLAIISVDYEYIYTNKLYKEILSIPEINPIKKISLSLLPKEFADLIAKPIDFNEGLVCSTITITIMGKIKHISVSRFIIKDEKDQINFVYIIRDLTELVNMEIKSKDQLSQIEFHSKAKDMFIANITHEIKTPLNAIIGLSYVLKNSDLSKKQKSIVDRISTSSDLLLNLINDVLDLSKSKDSSFKFYPTNILLTNLLSEVEGIATALIREKNVLWKTEYKYDHELCISADKTRLTQILLNLINNSSKFTEEGYIKLLVESLEEDAESVILKFTVEDTGLGVDSKDLGELFHEFRQLENPLTKQHKGTGLGLVICKNVINAMGGKIWVESEKHNGSKFIFTLPFTKVSHEKYISSLLQNSSSLFDGGGKRILVVEDNEINYEVVENLLSEVNIVCERASDGLKALQCCENAPEGYYYLILMDIHMPNMDGFTASKILKLKMAIKTPIIALSAVNIDELITEEYKNIIDAYIPKPFRFSQLYDTLSPYFLVEGKNPRIRKRILTETLEDPLAGKIEAIENLGGFEDIYNKHLSKFKSNYADSYFEIIQHIEKRESSDALRLAHSIKGLAGTLGLPYLEKASANLESALLNEEIDLEPFLSSFKNKLDAVCSN
jgi:signal transduction histidine kinase/HPt (histidine-containing phosphotransfer) domain-containing protein